MKRIMSAIVLGGLLAMGTALPASADTGKTLTRNEFEARAKRLQELEERVKRVKEYQQKIARKEFSKDKWQKHGPAAEVPELSGQGAAPAFALVICGALVAADVRRRKRAALA